MSKQVQLRGGTSAAHAAFIGALREVTVDTTNKSLRIHDGVLPGGHEVPSKFRLLDSDVDEYTIQQRLRTTYTLEMAYRTVDLGKWGPALQRLANNPNCRFINIAATQQNVFNLSGTVAINRSDLTISTPARWGATLNLEGSDAYLLDFGGTSAVRFSNYVHNLIFTRSNSTTSGAMLRFRNLYKWGYHNCRFFMDNKAWRGVELASCSFGRCTETLSEFPIREHIYSAGGAGDAGVVGGWAVGNQWDGMTIEGGHATTANPTDQGCILLDDHVAAHWFQDVEAFRQYGYVFYLRGTLANQGRNTLNLIYNPNVEATYVGSGTARIDNYQGTQIRDGWSEGNGCAAIWLTANSKSNQISDMQLGLKSANSYGVRDAGTNNVRNNMEYAGYTAGPIAGVRYDSTVKSPSDTETTVSQMSLGFSSAAANNANVNIKGVRYRLLSTGPFDTNLQGASNASISDVLSQDNASTPYVTAAASLALFPGYPVYYVSGTANIDNIPAGYMGQIITLRLASPGGTVRDTTTTGNNIVLAVSGQSYVSTAGRGSITLQWDGSLWWEISRNG